MSSYLSTQSLTTKETKISQMPVLSIGNNLKNGGQKGVKKCKVLLRIYFLVIVNG